MYLVGMQCIEKDLRDAHEPFVSSLLEWEKNGVIKEKTVTFFSGASMLLCTGKVLNKQLLDHDKGFSFFVCVVFQVSNQKTIKGHSRTKVKCVKRTNILESL